MKKLVFIAIFAVFFLITSIFCSAANRAVMVSKTANGDLEYLYIDSIRYNGDNVEYQTKYIFKNPSDELKKNNIAYVLNNMSINCATKEITYVYATHFDSKNTIKGSFPYPPNKTPIDDNTISGTKYQVLCKK
ncbi:MAG: surface-adhesin E family protein [bacterium]